MKQEDLHRHEHRHRSRSSSVSSSVSSTSTDISGDNDTANDATRIISDRQVGGASEHNRVTDRSALDTVAAVLSPSSNNSNSSDVVENMGSQPDVNSVSGRSAEKKRRTNRVESSSGEERTDRAERGKGEKRKSVKEDRKPHDEPDGSVKKKRGRVVEDSTGVNDDKDTKSPTTTKKKNSTSVKTSVQRAVGFVNVQMKTNTNCGVVMEDDNIAVYQDVFRVVYKNADDVYKTISEKVDVIVKEAEKNLDAVFKKKFDEFSANVERLVNQSLSRIREAAAATAATRSDAANQDVSHDFVIITQKGTAEQNGVFHITTAVDEEDLTKKLNRSKNQDKLVLGFQNGCEFNLAVLRGILKSEKMMLTKTRNDFVFNGGSGLKDLQPHLVNVINRHSSGQVTKNDYRLTFMGADHTTATATAAAATATTKRKVSGTRKEQKEKREDLRRSYVETYTDHSAQEDEEDSERCRPEKKKSRKADTVATPAQKKRKTEHESVGSSTDNDDEDD